MRPNHKLRGVSIVVASVVAACMTRISAAQSDAGRTPIVWDTAAAVGAGTGCFLGVDTMIAVNGGDMSVVFTNLGVSLEGSAGSSRSDVRTCTVKVPARVPVGLYPERVLQTFTYGIRKSAASSASLAATVSFFDAALRMPPVTADVGVVLNGGPFVATQTDSYAPPSAVFASFCRASRPLNGMLTANLSARGEIADAGERLVAFTDGLDLRWDMSASLASCAR